MLFFFGSRKKVKATIHVSEVSGENQKYWQFFQADFKMFRGPDQSHMRPAGQQLPIYDLEESFKIYNTETS